MGISSAGAYAGYGKPLPDTATKVGVTCILVTLYLFSPLCIHAAPTVAACPTVIVFPRTTCQSSSSYSASIPAQECG